MCAERVFDQRVRTCLVIVCIPLKPYTSGNERDGPYVDTINIASSLRVLSCGMRTSTFERTVIAQNTNSLSMFGSE